MQTLLLLTWLGAGAAATPPPTIVQVQAHALADTQSSKGTHPAAALADHAGHVMQARVDAHGKIEYFCDDADNLRDARSDTRTARPER